MNLKKFRVLNMNTLGQRLQAAMEARGSDAPALIAALKSSKGTVYNILDDTTKPDKIRAVTVDGICAHLGINREWLIYGTGDMSGGREIVRISGNETAPGYVRLPQIDLPAGAGPGAEVDAEPVVVRFVDVADQWASDNFGKRVGHIRVMTAKGDSMVGAGINSGDLLFVDISHQTWDGDGFYIVQFLNGWQVKRLRADILTQQLEIVSMPITGAESYAVPSDRLGELRIGGKVSAWWTLRNH